VNVEATMKEKTKRYAFQVFLSQDESERFEDHANKTGIKKYVIVRKALVKYLDEQEARK